MIHAILCTWLVLGAEWLIVLVLRHGQLAGLWEIQFGSLLLAPTVLAVGAIAALPAAALWNAASQSATKHSARVQLALLKAAVALGFAFAISGGRHFSAPGVRLSFMAVVTSAALLLVYWLGPRACAALQRRSAPQLILGVTSGCVALELINRFVLVRLYPDWHGMLALCVLLLAPGLAWQRPAPRRPTTIAVAVISLAALLAVIPSARRFSTFDNFRWVMAEQAPLLGQAVRANTALLSAVERLVGSGAPPGKRAPSAGAAENSSAEPNAGEGSLDLRERDILLVTMDAVRADHVGAYGYARNTTPELDRLAKDGVQFDQAYCPTPHTSYSVTSLLTGKYLRPLLLQGQGEDSTTLADVLRIYGYATAAFYPPAAFFIDRDRFTRFEQAGLGFEYRKVEFMEGEGRVAQVAQYLQGVPADRRVFLWVHLFAPHEPYEAHPSHDFGLRDVDRYDSEIAFADATMGQLVKLMRERNPNSVAIVTADHGEEFGEHGGRYHGSSVYDEQVRVPLIVSIPGHPVHGRVAGPVQTIDLFSTLHSALHIPLSPKIRGRDLSAALLNPALKTSGFAFAETDDQTLLAEGSLRVICERKVGACRLFDTSTDPSQQRDLGPERKAEFTALRQKLRDLNTTHGEYETRGATAAAPRWPAAILRGMTGDADAATDLTGLLDDSNVEVRRKASELLFRLHRPESAAALRLTITREEDATTRRYAALGLTRLGQGAPLVYDLLTDPDQQWRRLAALVLAETGDARGEKELLAWWTADRPLDFEDSRALIAALAKIRSRDAAWSLGKALGDVRLRPYLARALAAIGEESARSPLLKQLEQERYHSNRSILIDALLALDAKGELEKPLRRFLGVPDPVENGVAAAASLGILERLGGPAPRDLKRLIGNAQLGEKIRIVVPKALEDGSDQLRVIVRAQNTTGQSALVRIGRPAKPSEYGKSNTLISRKLSLIHPEDQLQIALPPGAPMGEFFAQIPSSLQLAPGRSSEVVVVAEQGVTLQGFAILPEAPELPPPPPEPWAPGASAPTPSAAPSREVTP
jgi:arylsulfatase A-like enzyme